MNNPPLPVAMLRGNGSPAPLINEGKRGFTEGRGVLIGYKLADRLKKRLAPLGYEIYSWEELLPAVKELIEFDNIFMYIILLIVIVVVALGILNTMLMSIIERTREFGIMMAMGTRPGQVVVLVMLESLFIGTIGILLGVVIGTGANGMIAIKGIDLSRWAGSLEIFAVDVFYVKDFAGYKVTDPEKTVEIKQRLVNAIEEYWRVG